MLKTKIKKGKSYDELSVKVSENMLEIYCEACENMGWVKENAYESKGKHVLSFKRRSDIKNKAKLVTLQKKYEKCFGRIRSTENSIYAIPALASAALIAAGAGVIAVSAMLFNPSGIGIVALFSSVVIAFMLWFFSWAGYLTLKNLRKEKAVNEIRKSYDEAMGFCSEAKLLTGVK